MFALLYWLAACAGSPVVAPTAEEFPADDSPGEVIAVPAPPRGPRLLNPQKYEVWGIDISHHQHEIDWATVAAQPRIRFAFMKATEGGTWTDPAFRKNWAAAREAGLYVGAYHYFRFCRSGESQAAHYLSVVPRDEDALPAVLDVEHLMNCAPDPDPAKVRAQIRVWLETVEAATGKRPIIYATADVIEDYLLEGDLQYRLWVRCTPEDPEPVHDLPWTFFQYDDQHTLAGIDTTVDRDVFRGSEAALVALTKPVPRAERPRSSK